MKRVRYCYSPKFLDYHYGDNHPLKVYRLHLAYELSRLCGLLDGVPVDEPEPCPEDALLRAHAPRYLEMLKAANGGVLPPGGEEYHLGADDNPVFGGVYDWSSLVCGASLRGARSLLAGECDVYMSLSGGLHHAASAKAAGFCYLNDINVAIEELLAAGRRVMYIDVDAHHGDGVEHAYSRTDRVFTISFHESGRFAYPGTGFEHEIGDGDGIGYCCNFPIYPYCDDDNYLRAFFTIVPPLVQNCRPDVLVLQLGADAMHGDPLATLNLTTHAFEKIYGYYASLDLPILALGGGGYDPFNVARAWTLALAAFRGVAVGDEIPPAFFEAAAEFGVRQGRLRDAAPVIDETYLPMVERETTRVAEKLQTNLFEHHFIY